MEKADLQHQHGPNGQRLCGARTRSGKACRGWAMPNGRCRMHGGRSLLGSASPTYKHGLYSRDPLARLAAIYEHAPDLASHLTYHPHREALRVALVYKNDGKEAARRLMAELSLRRLERRYGSLEAAFEAILGRDDTRNTVRNL